MNKLLIILSLCLVLIIVGVVFFLKSHTPLPNPLPNPTQPTSTSSTTTSSPEITTIAENLDVPWALAFLPDGNLLVTERSGNIKLVDKSANKEPVLISHIDVSQNGESGLHGIAVHPNFLVNKFIYIYHTYSSNGDQSANRVVRYKLENNQLTDQKIIVDQIPGAIFHDGGRIKFGPDGNLYITTGDALNPSQSQNINSLAGKILRVTDEGGQVIDNPFGNLIYSLGHRNPQGITWDDQGKLWETEHGNTATDELNLIEVGKNYGWPNITGNQTKGGIVSPVIQSGSSTWAPGGVAFLNGSLFFAGLRGQALFEFNPTDQKLTEHFKNQFGRIREAVVGPDGFLYITTSNKDGRGNPKPGDDKIIKINPQSFK